MKRIKRNIKWQKKLQVLIAQIVQVQEIKQILYSSLSRFNCHASYENANFIQTVKQKNAFSIQYQCNVLSVSLAKIITTDGD